MDTEALLVERSMTHGSYDQHAFITQILKDNIRSFGGTQIGAQNGTAWTKLNLAQRESLDMIAHKIGRILAGDPDFRDHWDDIAGYAKLVANLCTK